MKTFFFRIIFFTIIACISEVAHPASSSDDLDQTALSGIPRVDIGVIRWDAHMNNVFYTSGAEEVETLSYPQFFRRLPWYAEPSEYGWNLYEQWVSEGRKVTAPNSNPTDAERLFDPDIKVYGAMQSVVDQEIAFAVEAGIDYWAFCYYANDDPWNGHGCTPRNLFINSKNKRGLKWTAFVSTRWDEAEENWFVEQMQTDDFYKLPDGRPVLYFWVHYDDPDLDYTYPWDNPLTNDNYLTVKTVKSIRNKCAAAGVEPYIVALLNLVTYPHAVWNADMIKTMNIAEADAVTWYATWINDNAPYQDIINTDRDKWNDAKSNGGGKQVIPHISVGWDSRPRNRKDIGRSHAWSYLGYQDGYLSQDATQQQITGHLTDAMQFAANNYREDHINSVLIYAWNEFAEGGQTICPQLNPDNPSVINRECLDAVKTAAGNRPVPNVTLSAKYKVIFDENGGDTGALPGSKTVKSNSTTNLPIPPSKTGAFFSGWYTTPVGGGSQFTEETTVNDNITLYARWDGNTPDTETQGAPAVTLTSDAKKNINAHPEAYLNMEKTSVPFLLNIDFNQHVYDFTIDGISVVNGTAHDLRGSGKTYTVVVTPHLIENGTVSVTVKQKAAVNISGIANDPSTFTIDCKKPRYNVVFDLNGGTDRLTPPRFIPKENMAPENPTPKVPAENMKFMGWYQYDSDFVYDNVKSLTPYGVENIEGKTSFDFHIPINENITLVAMWENEKTTSSEIINSTESLRAYPNPVPSGEPVTIEGVAAGDLIEVFNVVGTCIFHTIASGETVRIVIHGAPGIYLIRAANGKTKMIIQ